MINFNLLTIITIITSILLLISFIINIYLLIKNRQYIGRLNFTLNDLYSKNDENKILQEKYINNIKQIESLKAQNKSFQEMREEFNKIQKESGANVKASLFDLGNNLSKELIRLHKLESNEAKKINQDNIDKTSTKFHNEFERIVSMVGNLSEKIENSQNKIDLLKTSLLSPSKAGYLAEITLENLLKSSGLRKEIDYHMQYHTIDKNNINHSNDGNSIQILRPDAVIFLPSDNLMIIDAKTSSFLINNNELNDNISVDNDIILKKTMNNHLKSLSSKDYSKSVIEKLKSKNKKVAHVITLMFLPTEQSLEKIIELDKNFLTKAWDNNIYPVGPTGIMNMLSFAKFQISQYLMLDNHEKILSEVKKLISSTTILFEHGNKMGNSLVKAMSYYDKFAASFNSNFLTKIKNINKLGINVNNKLVKEDNLLSRYNIGSRDDLINIEANIEDNTEDNNDKKNISKLKDASLSDIKEEVDK